MNRRKARKIAYRLIVELLEREYKSGWPMNAPRMNELQIEGYIVGLRDGTVTESGLKILDEISDILELLTRKGVEKPVKERAQPKPLPLFEIITREIKR